MAFFIFHSSFFIEFCEAKFLWASRFASLASGYPLHHLRSFALRAHLLRWFRYYPSRKNAHSL